MNSISQITSPDQFSILCKHLLASEYYDFQTIDDSGGDAGNDGYSESKKTLFAIYCPEKPNKVNDSVYKRKIKKDLNKAKKLVDSKKYIIKKWIFVTPAELRENVQTYIRVEASNKGMKGIAWSNIHLSNILNKYNFLRNRFPELAWSSIEERLLGIEEKMGSIIEVKKRYSKEKITEEIKSSEDKFKIELTNEQKKIVEGINKIHKLNNSNYTFENDYILALSHIKNKSTSDWFNSAAIHMANAIQSGDVVIGINIFFKSFQLKGDPNKELTLAELKNKISYCYERIQNLRHVDKSGKLKSCMIRDYDRKIHEQNKIPEQDYELIFKDFQDLLLELFDNYKLKDL